MEYATTFKLINLLYSFFFILVYSYSWSTQYYLFLQEFLRLVEPIDEVGAGTSHIPTSPLHPITSHKWSSLFSSLSIVHISLTRPYSTLISASPPPRENANISHNMPNNTHVGRDVTIIDSFD
jgi:hypothetical protein